MKKFCNFLMNLIILILFIFIFTLGFYFLKEYILVNDTVEIFTSNNNEKQRVSKIEEYENNINSLDSVQEDATININKYYYSQLDDYAKIIYNKINENKENMKSGNHTIDFGKTFNELLNSEKGEEKLNVSYQSALDAYLLDNPDTFYLDVTKLYLFMNAKTILGKTTYTVTIGTNNGESYLNESFYSQEKINLSIKEVEQQADNIISQTGGNITKIHNWLVDNIQYEQTISKNNIRNVYGAIVEGEVVCEGYAKAYKYLLDKIGVENIIVVGYGTNSYGKTEEHAWNYIKINNNWYAVDVTWDDPIIYGRGKLTNKNRYKYYLRGKSFLQDHEPTGETSQSGITFKYPELNEDNYIKNN